MYTIFTDPLKGGRDISIAGVGIILMVTALLAPAVMSAQQPDMHTVESFLNSQDSAPKTIEVMVLGTFHFKHVPDFNAITAPSQQKEIEDLVHTLSEFNPTKIALEFERKDSTKVDSLYNAYKNNQHQLTVNERQQIGFRLAKMMKHENVYPIDYQKPWGMDTVRTWAKKHDPDFVKYISRWQKKSARIDSLLQQNRTISEILSIYSSPAFLERIQKIRMRTLEVGADHNYIGIKPVASVYKRNMRIFANLTAVAAPGDRILIVYGAGHSYFFRNFIKEHPRMELIETEKYLP